MAVPSTITISAAIDPESDQIYVKIRSDVFRKNRTDYLKDKVEQLLGKVINHTASLDLDIQGDQWKILSEDEATPFKMVDENLLEINNDHFPTATFQRRMVAMTDDQGKLFYALEEDMDPHILRSYQLRQAGESGCYQGQRQIQCPEGCSRSHRLFRQARQGL